MPTRGGRRTMIYPRRTLLAFALLAVAACPARALTLLTTGKVADFRGPAGGMVRVGADRAFRTLRDPTGPDGSSVRFALSRRGADFEDHGEVALPSAGWSAVRGGFRYRSADGAPGGVHEIVYTRR